MDSYRDIWNLSLETFDAFRPHYKMAMVAVIKATGVNKGWFALYLARGCEPEPFTLQVYRHLNPYDSPDMLQSRIDDMVKGGFLHETDNQGEYRLTKPGRKAIKRIFHIAHREIGKIQALPYREIRRLADLLEYVVAAAIRSPEPVNKTGLLTSRWSDVGSMGPATTRIDQYITDLRRFYNDCQVASWRHYGVSGVAWRTLTALCDGGAHTPESLAGQCQHGFTVQDYGVALDELCGHGWITFEAASYLPTPKGRAIRAESERVTRALFFAPWETALHDDEVKELHFLFSSVLQKLAQIAA